jgi:LysR family transcriptional regulator for bpeEF and oprC
MDQLACMRSFVRVADLHSFTQAADALGLSRAVVSTHVAELERHLRCQLLHRTTRRVGLTADGSEYLARCQRMPKFTARYPDLQLEVQFNDRVVDLIREEIDLVVRVGAVREPHLIARRIVGTRQLTCASPEYLRTHGVPSAPDELRRHRLVGYLKTGGRRPDRWLFQRGAQRMRLALPFNITFNYAEAEIRAAIRGAGVVQAMDLVVAEALALGRLQVVLPEWSAPGKPVSVVCRAGLRDSPKIRVFADFASELLRRYRQRVDALLESPR